MVPHIPLTVSSPLYFIGLDCVFNCGYDCCADNIFRSYGVPPLSGHRRKDYRTITILLGLYDDWTGLYSLLVPTIPPPILLPGLHRLY